MVRTGLPRELRRRRWFPVVAFAALRFRRALAPFQRYRLATRLVAWNPPRSSRRRGMPARRP